jgi:hypothetical protein
MVRGKLFPQGDGSDVWVQFSISGARVSAGIVSYVYTGASGIIECSVAVDTSLKLERSYVSTGMMFTSRSAVRAGFGVAAAIAALGLWVLWKKP